MPGRNFKTPDYTTDELKALLAHCAATGFANAATARLAEEAERRAQREAFEATPEGQARRARLNAAEARRWERVATRSLDPVTGLNLK